MNRSAPTAQGSAASRSRAFREAWLRSERHRAFAVILVVGVVVLPILGLDLSLTIEPSLKIVGALAGLALLAIQLTSLVFIQRAWREGGAIPRWFEMLGVAAECSVPTGAVFAHIEIGAVAPYTALTAPPLLAYGILIGLTTLRLRPGLCVWAGAVAAAGYAAALGYVALGLGLAPPEEGWPRPGYFMAAVLIFTSGIAAAWVAREIRTHVEAALDEADARRRMERIEQDLSVARTIQQALLPHAAPDIPGFDIAGWNRPADQTGGDYYDWQPLPDGNWMIYLADVSGHGIGPALVTAACRAYMRAASTQYPDLVSLAQRVNRLLAEDLPDGRFITMVNLLIDPAGGPLAILSAGHGPTVLYLSESGEMRTIPAHGLPLAVVPDLDIGPAQGLTMAYGDVLVLTTDGIIEWARPGENDRQEAFGLKRLQDSLARHAHLPSAAIVEGVVRDAAAFAGATPQQDDVTLVVIRRGEGARGEPAPRA